MDKWDIVSVRSGEEGDLLEKGYEPFGVTTQDTSYTFTNSTNNKREVKYQSQDFIYLRILKPTKRKVI